MQRSSFICLNHRVANCLRLKELAVEGAGVMPASPERQH